MLKFLYENQPKERSFIPRKLEIKSAKTLLFGSILSGKTSLGLKWCNERKNAFYIDASDLRYNIDFKALCEFVRQQNISALCVDNLKVGPEILPDCDEILLISRQKSLKIAGFESVLLSGLDFEEFIAFSKNSDESTAFAAFMSSGNSLPTALSRELLAYSVFANTSELGLKALSANCLYESLNFNAIAVFRELKEKSKLSKNALYSEFEALEDKGIIAFARNYDENSRFKRMYFCDFALRKLFVLGKNPRKIIENMVFCELAKTGEQVYFKGAFDFYLPKSRAGVLVLPFLPPELALLRAKKLANDEIKEIIIISNATAKSENLNSCVVRFMSFATFAVGYLE